MVQWLRLCAPNLGGTGSIPGQEIKIPHAEQCGQEKKRPNEGRKWLDEYHHYLIHRSGGLGPSQSE